MRLAACIILIAAFLLGVYQVISAVGRPRRVPLTGSVAARHVVFQLAYMSIVVYLYLSGE